MRAGGGGGALPCQWINGYYKVLFFWVFTFSVAGYFKHQNRTARKLLFRSLFRQRKKERDKICKSISIFSRHLMLCIPGWSLSTIHTGGGGMLFLNLFSLSLILLGEEKIVSKSDNSGLRLTKSDQIRQFSEILAKSGAILSGTIALSDIFGFSSRNLAIYEILWAKISGLELNPPCLK